MKKSFLAASAIALCAIFTSSCADKMTDRHSEMGGGTQTPRSRDLRDYKDNGTPSNTDGMGRPMAGGKINTAPDSMWNQHSPLEGKPF